MFEYYVLNYNCNKHCVEYYNVFRNYYVSLYSEKAVKKYLRAPNKFEYKKHNEDPIYGFNALCKEIESIIKWQEWGRREYEISVADAFEQDCDKLEKWDCYMQCKPNIEMITREIIWQYKHKTIDK